MRYVDGFVMPIQKENLQRYRGIAQQAGKVWKDHGALQYIEAAGEDLDAKFGISFPKTLKLKPGDTVVISFIVFKSRAHRDSVNAKVEADPRMKKMMEQTLKKGPMPFEVKRVVYGGFKLLVDL